MTTAADRLIAQMRDQRKRWVDLEPGKRVQIIRPPEAELRDLLTTDDQGVFALRVELKHVQRYVCGWEGFAEADLVGPAGSSDAADFSPALWAEVVADRTGWISTTAQAILDAILDHQNARSASSGN